MLVCFWDKWHSCQVQFEINSTNGIAVELRRIGTDQFRNHFIFDAKDSILQWNHMVIDSGRFDLMWIVGVYPK